jgi:hypothetical protein
VNILEINDRDGIIIQSVTPARGGRLLGKCNGVGSTFVCENGGASSLDIVHVITYNHLNRKKQSILLLFSYKLTYLKLMELPQDQQQ